MGLIADELNVKTVIATADDSGLATLSFKANFKTLGRRLGKRMKAAADRSDAEAAAAQIAGVVLQVTAKASGEGRLFGSVGVVEVTEALASQTGLVVDRRQVTGDVVKDVGSHEFTVEIHAEVSVPVTVEVQAEA